MSRSTISTFQLFAMFPDEDSARVYLEGRIWPSGPVCPACGSGEHISALGTCATRKAGFYRCLPCGFDFTVRTNTVMERSKVPLHKWLYSMYLLVTARKGISSLQLAKEIGVTQKTAWFILGRLREACGGEGPAGGLEKLRGTVEVDECFVGGIEANKLKEETMTRTRTRTVGDRFISEANLSRKDEKYVYSRLRSTRVGPCLIRLRLTRRMRQLLDLGDFA